MPKGSRSYDMGNGHKINIRVAASRTPADPDLKNFRDVLRLEMESEGFSQPKAAKATGLSQSILSQYLNGTRFPDKLSVWGKLIRVFPNLVFNLIEHIAVEMRHDDRG